MDGEQRGIKRDADLVEDVGGEAPLGIGRFALVHLRFLRCTELDLELVAQGVESAFGLCVRGVESEWNSV